MTLRSIATSWAKIPRDETLGRIGAAEAEAARNEIMRRMLKAQARREAAAPEAGAEFWEQRRRWALAGAVALPVLGLIMRR